MVHVSPGGYRYRAWRPPRWRRTARWPAEPGSSDPAPRLTCRAITTNDTWLQLDGPGASFGDGLDTLTDNGPNGNMFLGGADVAVPGAFRNRGGLVLYPGSRLDVGCEVPAAGNGLARHAVDATGRGRIRAAGARDLAGGLSVDLDPAYTPPVGTVLNFITSDGRQGADDAFDSVVSPPYGVNGARKLRVDYERDHVRLWVDRVG